MIVVDAMNVRGSVPDGWWRDPDAALCRLVDAIVGHDWGEEWIVIVADGQPLDRLRAGTTGTVEVRFAGHSAPDAADDMIVQMVAELDPGDGPVTVVTSDRGLRDRLPSFVDTQGSRTFRDHVGW